MILNLWIHSPREGPVNDTVCKWSASRILHMTFWLKLQLRMSCHTGPKFHAFTWLFAARLSFGCHLCHLFSQNFMHLVLQHFWPELHHVHVTLVNACIYSLSNRRPHLQYEQHSHQLQQRSQYKACWVTACPFCQGSPQPHAVQITCTD